MFPIQDWVPSRSVPVVTRALIATYFTFEAPLSGISTNPARALGSALHANYWHALWIYFIAPTWKNLAAKRRNSTQRGANPK